MNPVDIWRNLLTLSFDSDSHSSKLDAMKRIQIENGKVINSDYIIAL